MPKLMFIGPGTGSPPTGGRAMLSRLHQDCLASIPGISLIVHELDPAPAGPVTAFRALGGWIDGVSPEAERAIIARIGGEQVDCVYLNGSNLGRLARSIKRRFPHVKVLTLFHNVEARFFLGAVRRRPTPRAVAVLIANHAAERLAARFSDRLIALTARDSRLLRRLYGREATDIVPMALSDQLQPGTGARGKNSGYALFVGGAFYANQDGITWYANEVSPHVRMRTVVVGQGMEGIRTRLGPEANVEVVGSVPALHDWYRDAAVAIAPIFDGSGMKTKVAEALMFGKPIVATSEALVGYEPVAAMIGQPCDSRESFVEALERAANSPAPAFDPALRRLYEDHYSPTALQRRLVDVLAALATG